MRTLPIFTVLIVALFLSASSNVGAQKRKVNKTPAKTASGSQTEPWQRSWLKFVEVHNACIKVKTCDRKRFLNKDVRWEGVVLSIDLAKDTPSIVMDMPGPFLTDQTGDGLVPGDLFVFVLNPEASAIAGWKAVAKGQRVRFLARTSGGITGSVVGFSSLPGRSMKMIMVNLDGGKFIERLPEVTKPVSTPTKVSAKPVPEPVSTPVRVPAKPVPEPVSAPVRVSAKPVPELTAEGYRDLIVKIADPVRLRENDVIKGMQALQSTPVCVLTLDPEKQKVAAQTTADNRKAWANARVPSALAASHAEILSWIESAESQFKTAPDCMYGGSMPLLVFFGTFGSYDRHRENARSALAGMGVTLPPIEKRPAVEKK